MSKAEDFYLVDLEFQNDLVPSASKDLQIINGQKNAIQALFNRLITVPGSLAHHPLYGVGAKLYQNKIADLSSQRELAIKIKSQFEQDFRVDKVVSVSFSQKESGEFLVRFKVKLAGSVETTVTFNPFGDFEI